MPEPIGVALRALDLAAMRGQLLFAGAPLLPKPRHRQRRLLQPSEGIEQHAVGGGVHQRAFVVLAVDFDQRRAQPFEGLRAHRLVVDEGAGAAVSELHPAQDQLVLGRDVVRRHQGTHRVPRRKLEGRGHLSLLGAVADQGGIAAGAEGEREGVEQNRFAGAGFAGQHGEARGQIDVEPIDQDDVADRKPGQHGESDDGGRTTEDR